MIFRATPRGVQNRQLGAQQRVALGVDAADRMAAVGVGGFRDTEQGIDEALFGLGFFFLEHFERGVVAYGRNHDCSDLFLWLKKKRPR
jgi:flagellar hook protein FlgE